MAIRRFKNGAPSTTLTSGINSSDSSFGVVSVTGWPSTFPFTATIDLGDLSKQEVVLVTSISGTTLTVSRGDDGTTAVSHSSGATIQHTASARDYVEANAHVNASASVHGVSGNVVGTTDAQTLSNKTLTAPVLNSPTVNSGLTVNSGVTVNTGSSTLRGVSADSVAVSGNASVSGNFSAVGTSTLGAVSASSMTLSGPLTTVVATSLAAGSSVAGSPSSDQHIAPKAYVDSKLPQSSQPDSPVEGQMWYDRSKFSLMIYQGGQWLHTEEWDERAGSSVYTTNGAGGGQVVFSRPTAVNAGPITVSSGDSDAFAGDINVIGSQVTTAGFGFLASGAGARVLRVNYVAKAAWS